MHLYSDRPAITLHEAGHVYDFGSRRYQGTYAALRLVPFVNLYHEYKASQEAVGYVKGSQTAEEERKAYHILYPAYGSYVGGAIFPIIGPIVGILIGHVLGRTRAAFVKDEAADEATEPVPAVATP